MRVFWTMVCALAIAAAVLAWQPWSGQGGASQTASRDDAANVIQRPDARDADDSARRSTTVSPGPAEEVAGSAATNAPAASSPAPVGDDIDALIEELLAPPADSRDRAVDADSLEKALSDASSPSDAATGAFDPGNPVDGTYVVGGSGTADDPFQITWDLLLLAAQTFVPREGRTEMPPRVQAMDGAHIRIEGYFAFPLASTDAREVLFMLNMWDGCCIGVPPSPYDAIEVRLKEPMGTGGKQYVNYGTLTGVLKVDPFVQDGWLLGIYLLQDGAINTEL